MSSLAIMCFSGGSRILKREDIFRGWGRQGADFLVERAGEWADFEGLYYQLRSDCTRPEALKGVREGIAPPA